MIEKWWFINVVINRKTFVKSLFLFISKAAISRDRVFLSAFCKHLYLIIDRCACRKNRLLAHFCFDVSSLVLPCSVWLNCRYFLISCNILFLIFVIMVRVNIWLGNQYYKQYIFKCKCFSTI